MYFWTYRLCKTLLDKCAKSPVSEDTSTSNTVNVPKHCRNLSASTITIFIDPYEYSWVLKSLSDWYEKSEDSLFTHWLPMKIILFLGRQFIARFSDTLKPNTKNVSQIFFAFSKFRFNFEHFKKKDHPHRLCIFELTDSVKRG